MRKISRKELIQGMRESTAFENEMLKFCNKVKRKKNEEAEWYKVKDGLRELSEIDADAFELCLDRFRGLDFIECCNFTNNVYGWCAGQTRAKAKSIFKKANEYISKYNREILFLRTENKFVSAPRDMRVVEKITISPNEILRESGISKSTVMPVLNIDVHVGTPKNDDLEYLKLKAEQMKLAKIPTVLILDDQSFFVSIPAGSSVTEIGKQYGKELKKLHASLYKSNVGRPKSKEWVKDRFDELFPQIPAREGTVIEKCRSIARSLKDAYDYDIKPESLRTTCWYTSKHNKRPRGKMKYRHLNRR